MKLRKIPLLALCAGLCGAASAQDRPASPPGTTVIEAARIVVAPDTVLTGPSARIAIRGGKVVAVGTEIPSDVLESSTRLRFEGAHVVPGFVNAHDHLALGGDLAEQIDAYTPDLRAAEAFDPYDDTLLERARGGVTSVALAPLSANTFGGLAAVVKWDGEEGVVAEDASYLKMALVEESLQQDRPPTSRMGAADLIRTRFHDAQNPLTILTPDVRVLRDALAGSRKVAVHARTLAEITSCLELCTELSLTPVLVGCDEAHDALDSLGGRGLSIALSPLTLDSTRERLAFPAQLAAAGVPFSFIADDPAAMRLSAALAVRHGLGRDAAIGALTRVPAEQCGMADRIGSLRVGCDADLLVFDGDPIDLGSRLEAVFVGGERLDSGKKVSR